MNDEQLTIVPIEQLPQTDEPKKKKVSINELQQNLIRLMERDRVELVDIHEATKIHFTTIYDWYKGKYSSQLLDINIKELADYFDVSVDFLAFGMAKYKYDTFDKEELETMKNKTA